jgi:hypothetical protein
VRRSKRQAAEVWEAMGAIVRVRPPARAGERASVVAFVERQVADPPGGAHLLIAGEHVVTTFPGEVPEPWTWVALVVECTTPPEPHDARPANLAVVSVGTSCSGEAPEWHVRRSMRARLPWRRAGHTASAPLFT